MRRCGRESDVKGFLPVLISQVPGACSSVNRLFMPKQSRTMKYPENQVVGVDLCIEIISFAFRLLVYLKTPVFFFVSMWLSWVVINACNTTSLGFHWYQTWHSPESSFIKMLFILRRFNPFPPKLFPYTSTQESLLVFRATGVPSYG